MTCLSHTHFSLYGLALGLLGLAETACTSPIPEKSSPMQVQTPFENADFQSHTSVSSCLDDSPNPSSSCM
jgi:hypothetical protein